MFTLLRESYKIYHNIRKDMILYKNNRFWLGVILAILILLGLSYISRACIPNILLSNYLNKNISHVNGLELSYFSNSDYEGVPKKSVVKLPISFAQKDIHWKHKDFSLKYKGILKIPKTGTYCIGTSSDDGSYIYLNGDIIINNGGIHPLQEDEVRIYLIKSLYLFELDYFQKDGELALNLFWEIPGRQRELISNEYMFLLKDTFPRERFDFIRNVSNNSFDLLKLFLFGLLFLILCLFIAIRIDLSFLFRMPDVFQKWILRYSYLWLILIGIVSVISNMEVWVTRHLPFIYIPHILLLYLYFGYVYAILKNKSRYWNLRSLGLFSGIYIISYVFIMFRFPLENFMNIEDMLYCFNRAGCFLRGDYTNLDYPVLAYWLFGICYKLSFGNFNLFLIVVTFVRFLFLMWLFYFFYSFSESVKMPVFGFIFSLFFIIAPFSVNWLVLRYDVIPTTLVVGSLFYFYKKRYYLSCILNALGFMFKWFPVVAFPFMLFYLFYKKQYKEFIKILSLYLFIILTVITVFSPSAFFSPFIYQGKRLVMGESFFNLFLAWFHGPQPLAGISRDLPEQGIFTHEILSIILLSALSVVFLIFLFNLIKGLKKGNNLPIIYGCWAIIAFILFNRIFSPQFIQWFYGVVFVFLLVRLKDSKWLITTLFFLGLASVVNLIIPHPHGAHCEYYIYQKLFFWLFFIIVCMKLPRNYNEGSLHNSNS